MTPWPIYEQPLRQVSLPSQLPLEFPHPHPREGWSTSLPVASHGARVPSTSCPYSRSKTKLMKWEARRNGNPFHFWPALPPPSPTQKAVSLQCSSPSPPSPAQEWIPIQSLFPRRGAWSPSWLSGLSLCHSKVASATCRLFFSSK